jgi:alkanesulfonate monooxygenase SsuD/methylene tetrahydromethanopterin reductase-like flavin-dependent oxidoreductase (luciferase family)
VGRSVLITSSDNEANDILDDPKGVFTNYFLYLNSVSKLASGIAGEDINLQSEIPDAMKKAKDLIIIGSEKTVTDKLIELIDKVGPFGTLLLTGHDIGEQKQLWENSFSTMSNKIQPILSDYIKQKF